MIANNASSLTEKALLETIASINRFTEEQLLSCKPTTMYIPAETTQWLCEEGYDTPEKVMKLINDIVEN